jgi:hypothetical protein
MRASPLLLGCLPLLGVIELGLHHYFATRAPGFDDYEALGRRLAELKQPGVPIVVAPSWAEPLVRQAAPAAFPIAELARADDGSFASLLEISLLGERAGELSAFPLERELGVGPFRLLWHRNTSFAPTLFDFVGAVEAGQAGVFAERQGARQRCRFVERERARTGGLHGHVAYPRARFECGAGSLLAVSLIEDERYRPHRCVLAHFPDSEQVVLRFDAVPPSARLVGYAGFSYFLERDYDAPQIELGVSEGSRALGAHRASGSRGWARFELARGAPGVVEVTLRRLAPSGDVCFALEAR